MNNNTIPLEAYFFIAVTAAFLSYVTFKDTTTPDEKGASSSESIIPVLSPTAPPEAEIPVAEEVPEATAEAEAMAEEEEPSAPPQVKEGGKRKSKKSKSKKNKSQKSPKKKRSIKSHKK